MSVLQNRLLGAALILATLFFGLASFRAFSQTPSNADAASTSNSTTQTTSNSQTAKSPEEAARIACANKPTPAARAECEYKEVKKITNRGLQTGEDRCSNSNEKYDPACTRAKSQKESAIQNLGLSNTITQTVIGVNSQKIGQSVNQEMSQKPGAVAPAYSGAGRMSRDASKIMKIKTAYDLYMAYDTDKKANAARKKAEEAKKAAVNTLDNNGGLFGLDALGLQENAATQQKLSEDEQIKAQQAQARQAINNQNGFSTLAERESYLTHQQNAEQAKKAAENSANLSMNHSDYAEKTMRTANDIYTQADQLKAMSGQYIGSAMQSFTTSAMLDDQAKAAKSIGDQLDGIEGGVGFVPPTLDDPYAGIVPSDPNNPNTNFENGSLFDPTTSSSLDQLSSLDGNGLGGIDLPTGTDSDGLTPVGGEDSRSPASSQGTGAGGSGAGLSGTGSTGGGSGSSDGSGNNGSADYGRGMPGYVSSGGGKGGNNGSGDASATNGFQDFLAKFLPGEEDAKEQGNLEEFRAPASEEGKQIVSLIDSDVNIFMVIHDAYQLKSKHGAVGSR